MFREDEASTKEAEALIKEKVADIEALQQGEEQDKLDYLEEVPQDSGLSILPANTDSEDEVEVLHDARLAQEEEDDKIVEAQVQNYSILERKAAMVKKNKIVSFDFMAKENESVPMTESDMSQDILQRDLTLPEGAERHHAPTSNSESLRLQGTVTSP